jgi:hypothetical protein
MSNFGFGARSWVLDYPVVSEQEGFTEDQVELSAAVEPVASL